MRIDVVALDPLLAELRDEPEDVEIVVVATGSQELPRLDRNRLAHTFSRVAKPDPAPALAPVAPVQPSVADDPRPIDELVEARVVAPTSEVSPRPRAKNVAVIIALACGVVMAAAYLIN